MHKTSFFSAAAPFAAILLITACGQQEPEVVGEMADPNADEIEPLDPSEMPAMERGSASYRCDDGSVVYVTFFTNDTQVGVRADQNAPMTVLANEAMAAAEEPAEGEEAAEGEESAAEETGGPIRFSGEGQTLVGTGGTITYNGQSCSS